MIETADLILDKGRYEDWKDMYENVWSRPEANRYMFWKLSDNEEEARQRVLRTIDFQKDHDMYTVYEKKSGRAIGFAGVEQISEGIVQESGICLGPDYTKRGYGKQILNALVSYCEERYAAKEFHYRCQRENIASQKLAESCGFVLAGTEQRNVESEDIQSELLVYKKVL